MNKNRIRILRKNKNLSLKSLAMELKKEGLVLTPDALGKYERSEREPRLATWIKLAEYFNVTVPYLQGITYGKKEFCEIAVKIIHNYYFMNYKKLNMIFSQNHIIKITSILGHHRFYEEVDTFIKITTNGKSKLPYEFYKKDEKEFKIIPEIKAYWYKLFFDFITKETDLYDLFSPKEMEQELEKHEFIDAFADKITTAVNNLRKKSTVTALGYMFRERFSEKEKTLHNKALDAIQFYDFSDAKRAINEYSKFISELKNAVNNFDTLEYFKNYILNAIIPVQRLSTSSELSDWYDEVVNEVKNNNKELIKLIVNEDTRNVINVYKEYLMNKDGD